MKYINLIILFIFRICIGIPVLHAQQTIPSSGGNATGNGGSASYSVGQIVYTTNVGTNGTVLQGVQQPFEISVVTGVAEAKGIILQSNAFPNPTSDNVTLKIDGEVKAQYMLYLYDIHGKLLLTQKVEGNETNIVMTNLDQAIYFLKVTCNNKEVKTFKIIKN